MLKTHHQWETYLWLKISTRGIMSKSCIQSVIDALRYRQQLLPFIDSRDRQALTVHYSNSLNTILNWPMTKLPAMFAIWVWQCGLYEIRWMVVLTVLWSWDASKTREGSFSCSTYSSHWHGMASPQGSRKRESVFTRLSGRKNHKVLDFSSSGWISGTK